MTRINSVSISAELKNIYRLKVTFFSQVLFRKQIENSTLAVRNINIARSSPTRETTIDISLSLKHIRICYETRDKDVYSRVSREQIVCSCSLPVSHKRRHGRRQSTVARGEGFVRGLYSLLLVL